MPLHVVSDSTLYCFSFNQLNWSRYLPYSNSNENCCFRVLQNIAQNFLFFAIKGPSSSQISELLCTVHICWTVCSLQLDLFDFSSFSRNLVKIIYQSCHVGDMAWRAKTAWWIVGVCLPRGARLLLSPLLCSSSSSLVLGRKISGCQHTNKIMHPMILWAWGWAMDDQWACIIVTS